MNKNQSALNMYQVTGSQKCQISKNDEDTNVSRAYAGTHLEDNAKSIPGKQKLKQEVADLLTQDSKNEKANDLLTGICQTFSIADDIDCPLISKDFGNHYDKFFVEKLTATKLFTT